MIERLSYQMGGAARHAVAEPTRNLLIIHTPWHEDISDWLEIKRRINENAPDIEVRIATNGERNSVARKWQVSRPSLVVSLCPVFEFEAKGGAIHIPRPIHKLEQMERLARHGLPVPLSAKLTPNMELDPAQWSRYALVKPFGATKGQGIRLVRTADLAARYADLTSDGKWDMLVQRYIDHAEDGYPTGYRVLTLFGRVVYALQTRWAVRSSPLEEIASDPEGIIASNTRSRDRLRQLCNEAQIISLAEQAYAAFPECALLAVDIIRDVETGKQSIVEVNPEGLAWHLSSPAGKEELGAEFVRDLYAQFDALGRMAETLIDKTRTVAC